MGIWFEVGVLVLLALIVRQLHLIRLTGHSVYSKLVDALELQRDTIDAVTALRVDLSLGESSHPPDPYDTV